MEPRSFIDALDFISSKVVHADWDAEQWLRQEPDIRARAFWLSKVETARFLNRALKDIEDFMRGSIEEFPQEDGTIRKGFKVGGRADFVRRTRESMIKEGMLTEEELDRIKQNSDTDVKELASRSRLKLVFDTNVRSAWGYGHWKQGMQPHVLRRYPAARFIRVPGAREPRIRHLESEGDIRLKTDNAYWADYQNAKDIGGFEVPWAPYGFHSYMEQEDVSRKGAEAAGLNVSSVVPSKKRLNDGLSAGTKTMDPAIKKRLIEQLKREQVLHKAQPSAKELAKKAAQKARLSSIERSLQKAQGRGDAAEVARIQKVLEKERSSQNLENRAEFSVVDRGDYIDMEEKPRKDGRKVSDAKKTEKIFNSLDRRSIESRWNGVQKDIPKSFTQTSTDSLTLEEKEIAKSPHEIGLIYRGGVLRKVIQGEQHKVGIPKEVKGEVVSHNHPGGRGLSDSDFNLLAYDPEEIRIVARRSNGSRELYSVKPKRSISNDELTVIKDFYLEETRKGGDSVESRRNAFELTKLLFDELLEMSATLILR